MTNTAHAIDTLDITLYLTINDIIRITGKSKDTISKRIYQDAVLDVDYIFTTRKGRQVMALKKAFVDQKLKAYYPSERHDILNSVSELDQSSLDQSEMQPEKESKLADALQSHIDTLETQLERKDELIKDFVKQKQTDQDLLKNMQIIIQNYQTQVSKLANTGNLIDQSHAESVLKDSDKSNQGEKKKSWFSRLFQ